MAEILLLKTKIMELFIPNGMGMKYSELGINIFGAIPISDQEDNHLIMLRKNHSS